jgi:hypothetical protein
LSFQGFAIGAYLLTNQVDVPLTLLTIALGYLYSVVSLSLIRPENARAVLAAGCLLGGMDDLCQFAYETCRRSITIDTISEWLSFVEAIPPTADGTATPESSTLSVFGQYTPRLRDDVFHFLVVILPEILEIHKPPQEQTGQTGRDLLLQIYARAPFELFKSAVESPTFQIGRSSIISAVRKLKVDFQDLTRPDSNSLKRL